MRILVAEDDGDTADLIAATLRGEGHEVETARAGNDALDLILQRPFDIAILDRMLPGKDGMEVLRAARTAGKAMHVLMLTALGSIANRVEGLDAGADDYQTKPFAMSELVARIHALERRVAKESEPTTLTCGPLFMNILRRELRFNDKLVPLQPRELQLLEELMRNYGRVLTRTILLERVWGFRFEPQTNLVETHMSRLRSKLALAGAKDLIRTVRGSGYCLGSER
jgi:two-component system, OmpR family, response regulator